MRNRCRNISSAAFGIFLLLPLLAIGFLQLGQAYIQSTRDERLETEKLVTVVLPASKVVWEEEEKELWVGDQMFDVASYKVVGDDYHLTGIFDEDETAVAGSLLHLLFSGKTANLLRLLFLLQCFSMAVVIMEFALRKLSARLRFPFYSTGLLFFPKLVLGPPPRQ